jgi:hypothetical protein
MNIDNLKSVLTIAISDIDELTPTTDILVLERAANFYGTKNYYLSSEYTRTGSGFPFVADSSNKGSAISFRGTDTGSNNEIYLSDGSSWNLLMNLNDDSAWTYPSDDLYDLTTALQTTNNNIYALDSNSHPFDLTDIFNMGERQSSGLIHTRLVDSAEVLTALDSSVNILFDTHASKLMLRNRELNNWKVV